jgi:uncharacterized protein (DUF433 family)
MGPLRYNGFTMSLAILSEPIPLTTDAHGVVRVGGTRVTLDTVISAYLRGEDAERITESYPAISLADVYATIGYYLRHRDEVNEYLQTREAQAQSVRQEVEGRFGTNEGLRERLLARQRG